MSTIIAPAPVSIRGRINDRRAKLARRRPEAEAEAYAAVTARELREAEAGIDDPNENAVGWWLHQQALAASCQANDLPIDPVVFDAMFGDDMTTAITDRVVL